MFLRNHNYTVKPSFVCCHDEVLEVKKIASNLIV